MSNIASHPNPIQLSDDVLRNGPLPIPSSGGDKEEHGRIMVVAGSRKMAAEVPALMHSTGPV